MDPSRFGNDTDPSDENYAAFVEWLSELTTSELRAANGDPERQKQALCRCYKRGDCANLTLDELIDFLGVSTPSILDRAGYTEEEGDAVMQISDTLSEEEIEQADLNLTGI